MSAAAASADRAPPSADRQMVSFLGHENSVMTVPVFAATQDPSSALDASWQ